MSLLNKEFLKEQVEDKGASYRFAASLTPDFHKPCNLGVYQINNYDPETRRGDVIAITADTEYNFYKLFINLMMVQIDYEQDLYARVGKEYVLNRTSPVEPLAKVDVEYLAVFMTMPLTFTLSYSKTTNHFKMLGDKLGKSECSARNAYVRIRKAKYLRTSEDKEVQPCPELQKLRVGIKQQLEANGFAMFAYNFTSVIKPAEFPIVYPSKQV
jgi:hypothetical protein